MQQDERYMRRCLDLAVLGMGTVSPNPMVGAVIVYENRIIGEGYTSPYGGPHAEVNAVEEAIARFGEQEASKLFHGSTLYVSLEPCAHYGKTPPCADMLVAKGFNRVVIGCLDPFAKVNGQGVKKLRDGGIATELGVLEQECLFLNRRFFTRVTKQRPYVILKWAETSDRFFAPEEDAQRWITNKASRQLVHKWRSEEDAVLVGAATAIIDNPALTTRLWKGKHPKRIVIDRDLRIADDAAIFDGTSEAIVFNAKQTDWKPNKKLIQLENFDLYLAQNILYQLYLMDVQSLIVEGGAKTLQLFLDAGLWDEARVFESAARWGKGKASPRIEQFPSEEINVGDDRLKLYYKEV
ncbi:diaminohydroxyphosphoribosylaminopyrimidine deaminase [Sphingobacterium allocomposti]|uniref:Riboflavin biosynthesis protein RibD n=1 Tax=Sphingobacterium allocomposti TaxID=415956 RepID=A0A5S5DPD8_9SPHI|nr:bifunctional diaminohydroxyphosphoribosylaminopyrimidine deaminase/5-amino-6-(5-phosphoribosylamino)uracil reductase RibD [Sphingobacterium composti Yoo et al. 2007 non Ten et al. 2007]TYP97238.1 diaminohydroxyphosphoribosylaminopyrimidine deaminase [Sphingobacterium composti Yoo et al. 2007 non Ten et al. 2007]